jgi:predicted dehydrogenase
MKKSILNRRTFIQATMSGTALLASASTLPRKASAAPKNRGKDRVDPAPETLQEMPNKQAKIKFAVIGINHDHINQQIDAVRRGGGELVGFYAKEPDLADAFAKRYPQAKRARSEDEILQDKAIHLVVSAAIPDERAPLGIRVMQHDKDYMSDKPGITSLEQLSEVRRVQAQTRRIYSIMYSERLENRASVKAGELVKAGAIGKVVQTLGLGPHQIRLNRRPDWFFDLKRYGGILSDIGSHQADQFLYFTGSTQAEVVSAQVGNVNHPQHPGFQDFGDVVWRGDSGTGYVRVDWFTPDGLGVWGDGRMTILGTEGYIEIRKYIDLAGKKGANHLFLVDQKETRYMDCNKQDLPYGAQLVTDILERTETAMPQKHCFLATELALKAQKQAQRLILKG